MTDKLKARLVCLHMGNDSLLEDIELFHNRVYSVGRNSGSSIFLKLDDISKKHAEFGYSNDAWNIIDCNSTNGVYVNGKKTSLKKLKNGDEIQIGSALFCYQEDGRAGNSSHFSKKITYGVFGLVGAAFIFAGVFFFHSYTREQSTSDISYETLDIKPADTTPRITREELISKKSSELNVYFYAKNENVLILDFPTLRQHGLMFNRMLAFAEAPGISKNVLLGDRELLRFIKKKKLTFETFAFGNDFMVKVIVDFFNLANQTSVELNDEELRLRNILLDHEFIILGDNGIFKPTLVDKAVISITQLRPDDPSTDVDELIDLDIRRAVLQHELSHGEFFTNKHYRDYCIDFWFFKIFERERKIFRKMFLENSYDVDNEALCINEMQAYLMNTPDKRLFSAAMLGVTENELKRLQSKFLSGNPPTDLYDDWPYF